MHYSKSEQLKHMQKWSSSGLSKMAYCRKYQIAYNTFMNWFSRNEITKPKGKFVDLNDKPKNNNLRIVFPNGITISYDGPITEKLVVVLKDA